MKERYTIVARKLVFLFLLVTAGLNAQFSPGNLAVFQADASASNTTGSVQEVNISTGTAGINVTVTGTGTEGIRFSGSATSTAYLSNSADKTGLFVTGHNSTNTTSNANTLNPRAVLKFVPAGTYAIATTYTGSSGDQTRSATTVNNTNYFIGDQGGIHTNGSTAPSPVGNFRSVKPFGGTVYAFSSSTSLPMIGTLANPTGSTSTALNGLPATIAANQDFYMVQSGSNGNVFDLIYVLSATSNTVGTITKYYLNTATSTWTAAGTYSTGAGGFSLCAKKTAGGVDIYFTTGQGALTTNAIRKITDSAAYNATMTVNAGSVSTLYTAASGKILKGIAFTPETASPIIITGSLTAVSTIYGTPSSTTSFSVSASGLSADLIINAPAGFEVSVTSGGTTGFATSAMLTTSGGNVAATTVYVRLAATTTAGTYSGSVSLTSGTFANSTNMPSSTVNQKAVTFSGVLAQNKTYDGTNAATISGTVNGAVNLDNLTLVGNGTFAQTTVGTAILVTPNVSLSGDNISSYSFTQPSGLSADIIARELTLTNVLVSDKEYDGNTSATISAELTNAIAGDEVYAILAASFESPSVGNDINVISETTLGGAAAANYYLTQPTNLQADITAKSLTVLNATAQNKVYDGNTDAVITGTLSGVIEPDQVFFEGIGVFESPNVGVNIPVMSVSVISGDLSNYVLVQPTGLSANISADELQPQTITFDPIFPVYYGDADFDLTATASSGLSVSYASSNTDIAVVTGSTVTIIAAGTVDITATQSGDLTYDSATPVIQTLTVYPKDITIDPIDAVTKTYDGTTAVTVTGTLSGIVGSDEVDFIGTANFVAHQVATGQDVIVEANLTGTDAVNYNLVQPFGLTGDITPAALTVSGLTASNKPYDTTTAVAFSGGILDGVIGADQVSFSVSGAFVSADAGTGISVDTSITLTGADASNYSIVWPALSADITPAPLTISGLSATDKVYDGTTVASVSGTPVLNGILGSDSVTVSGSPAAAFDNKNVGTNKTVHVTGYTLAGAQASNYALTLPAVTTADVTVAFVTLTNAQAQDKFYDGTNTATLTGTVNGVIGADVVTLVGTGTFAQSAIGTDIPVTSAATLSGTDAANYTINPQPTGLSADILDGPTVLAVGDISILGFQSNAPDTFAFVTWVDLKPETIIKFTDNGFLAATSANATNNGRGGENFVIWKNNGAQIPAGTVVQIQDSATPTSLGTIVSGALSGLSSSGDNIFAFQGAATSGSAPDWSANANPSTFNGNLIYGLYFQASSSISNWLATGTASSNSSYLPTQLNVTNCNIAIGASATRGQYTGSRTSQASFADYKTLVNNPANWTNASGSGTTTLNLTAFTLATPPSLATISGEATICASGQAQLSVVVTGGTGPYSVVISDGNQNFSINGYTNGTTIPVAPSTTATYTLVSVTDANGLTAQTLSGTASVTVNGTYTFYVDADFDGFGSELTAEACAVNAMTPPSGFSINNTDCNDSVAAINPGHAEVAYNGVDDNCDGQLDEGNQLTTQVIPAQCGSTLTAINSVIQVNGVTNATKYRYRVYKLVGGVPSGAPMYAERAQPYFTLTNLSSYEYATTYRIDVEVQRNNIWLGYYGATCDVSSPAILDAGGAGSVNPSQCGSQIATISSLIYTTSLNGVTGYRFRVTNLTDPTAPNQVQTIDRTTQWFSLPMLASYNYGTTYLIEVAVKTTGTYGGYGAGCEISTPAVPMLVTCDQHMSQPTSYVYTSSMNKATSYRFEVSLVDENDLPVSTQIVDRNIHYFNFAMVPGYVPGGKYMVRVAVRTAGWYSPYGEACFVYAPVSARNDGSAKPETLASVFDATVFPNPYSESFLLNLESTSEEKVEIRVYDMVGKLLDDRTFEHNQVELETFGARYPSGVYNIVLTQGANVKTLRVIKR